MDIVKIDNAGVTFSAFWDFFFLSAIKGWNIFLLYRLGCNIFLEVHVCFSVSKLVMTCNRIKINESWIICQLFLF